MTTTRRGLLAGAATLGAGLLAGCTAAGAPEPTPSATRTGYGGVPLTRAAEPGDAPEPTESPVGRVIALPEGGRPWGVAAADGRAYVALRDPARLAVVDLDAGSVGTVAMTGSARMIDVAASGVLLYPAESANRLLELALPSLDVVRSVPTRRQPHQAVQVGGETWISEEFGHAVRVVRGTTVLADLPQPVQPGGITAVAGRVAVVDVAANLLLVYGASTRWLVVALPAGEGPSHVVPAGGSRVAVCDVRGNAVLTYDVGGTPRRLGRAAVPGRAFWVEADATSGTVYTALSDANRIARLRLDDAGAPVLDGMIPTVRQPISFDLDGDRLLVAGYAASQLQVVPVSAFSSA